MVVPRGTRLAGEHDDVFSDGAAIVGPVSADMEYVSTEDKARGKQPNLSKDEVTGLLRWKVTAKPHSESPSAVSAADKSAA